MPDPLPSSGTQPGQDSASGSGSSTFDPGTGPLPPAPPSQVPELNLHTLPTQQPELTPPPAAAPPAVPGYEILEVLGRGGMGIVYKARQTGLGRTVALKMILHAEHAGADARQRFRTEAEALARLQHPHIVQIHEVGECSGLPYFVLEFCGGGSLAGQLDGTPWPPAKAAALVETLARAIDAAHRAHVIHRDLNPANVLLTADGQPKITDFGLAKKLDEQAKTKTGVVMGTPSYMAPEQAGGKPREVGPAADVYALGAVLYELLTGRPPFKAATPLDTMVQVLSEEPVAVRRLQPAAPRSLETVCSKCLEKDPKRRYISADALADDLRRFLEGRPVRARPAGAAERLAKWVRRRPALASLCLVILLAGVAFLALGVGFTLRLQEARDRAQMEADKAYASLDILADPFDEPVGIDVGSFRPSRQAGEGRRVRDLLKHARERMERRPDVHPVVRAAAFQTIGSAYCNLGLYDQAEPCLQEARRLLENCKETESKDLAACYQSLGQFHHDRGKLAQDDYRLAEHYYSLALGIRQQPQAGIDEWCESKFHLAWLKVELGDYRAARELFTEVLSAYLKERRTKDRGYVLALMGRTSVTLEEQGWEEHLGALQEVDLETIRSLLSGSEALLNIERDGDWQEAFQLLRQGLARRLQRDVLTDQFLLALHTWPRVVQSPLQQAGPAPYALGVAQGLLEPGMGKKLRGWVRDLFPSPEPSFRRCDQVIRERKGPAHFYRTIPLFFLARVLEDGGAAAEADWAYRECLEVARQSVGLEHAQVPAAVKVYGSFLHRQKRTAEAHRLFAEVIAARKERFGDPHFIVARAQLAYADFLKEIKDLAGLKLQCEEVLAIYGRVREPQQLAYPTWRRILAKARRELGQNP
jgi:tetratricopeptide (TPR) repeat protein